MDRIPGVARLLAVLDAPRDGYLEWHDGPDYSPVEAAVRGLGAQERPPAADLMVGRLAKGYDWYTGHAAALLAREPALRPRLVAALESLLDHASDFDASHAAVDLCAIEPSARAEGALRDAARRDSASRMDALVCLKTALDLVGRTVPRRSFVRPETVEVLLDAVRADDYLVRYHAAEALWMLADRRDELTSHEVFLLICGPCTDGGIRRPTTEEDRARFAQAAERLREMVGEG